MTTHVSTWCMFGFTSDLLKLCGDRDFFVAPMCSFCNKSWSTKSTMIFQICKVTLNHHGFSSHAKPNMHLVFEDWFFKVKMWVVCINLKVSHDYILYQMCKLDLGCWAVTIPCSHTTPKVIGSKSDDWI